jgi:hypothetical protein
MKNFLLFLLAVLGLIFLYMGYNNWIEKTEMKRAASPVPSINDDSASKQKEPAEEDKAAVELDIISNWPEEAKEGFSESAAEGSTYKLAIVGSTAMGIGEGGWGEQVKKSLEEEFGSLIDVQLVEFDGTSSTFLDSQEMEEVVRMAPDMVLFEPFSLNDNTYLVPAEKNHSNIEEFFLQLRSSNDEIVLILQPTHPIAGATVYPQQVEELQSFAETNGYTYLNHWAAWPEEETLGEYLEDTQEEPNEAGHEVWAEFVTDFFIEE